MTVATPTDSLSPGPLATVDLFHQFLSPAP